MTFKKYFYVCGKPQSKISGHLKGHRTHAGVVHVFTFPDKSKERKILFEKNRNGKEVKFKRACLNLTGS